MDHLKENRANVEQLRRGGYKIRVHHHRKISKAGVISSRGGKTVVEVTTPDGKNLIGIARCSKKENFNKKLGVRIALGRAFKQCQSV